MPPHAAAGPANEPAWALGVASIRQRAGRGDEARRPVGSPPRARTLAIAALVAGENSARAPDADGRSCSGPSTRTAGDGDRLCRAARCLSRRAPDPLLGPPERLDVIRRTDPEQPDPVHSPAG